MAAGLNKIRLSTNPTDAAIAALQIGDIVYLDGTIYTCLLYTSDAADGNTA